MAKMNKKLISLLQTLPSMGMAFIVLGVLLMVASFAFSIPGNSVLFAGLFFILAGVAGFVYYRVGGKRSSFPPTFVFRPLTPPYMRFRIRRFLFWVPFDV